MKRNTRILLVLGCILGMAAVVYAWTSVPVVDDPLVRMPGTQPGQVALQAPTRCMNCHAGYNESVEPGFNWMGSMMAQSARDFLFWACFTVSAQDSIWAVGRPNATDICERCHFPKGWLEGRSDPTNASLMTGADYDGVQCDFCHRMWDPQFETTHAGTREGGDVDMNGDGSIDAQDWALYWDETNTSGTPSQPAADSTYAADMALAQGILLFNSPDSFFTNNLPPANYTESASGQFFVSPDAAKRASFADAQARHQMSYSRFHKSKYMCATCHDVSNPILANLINNMGGNPDATPTLPLTTENDSAFSYFHVERTFSEFMLSDYGQPGGAATNPEFQIQGAPDITHAAKCQDCHMRDVVGKGADLKNAVVRPDESVEHPSSGQPLHDLTGGNAWVSWVLASAVPGSPNHVPMNDDLLNGLHGPLTLDLTQGEGIDPAALLAGVERAKQQLLLAATIKNVSYNPSNGALSFQVQNNGAHKLISGFPEGRRMFVNIKAYSGGSLIYEVNPYDTAAGTLKGLDYPYQPEMGLPDPLPMVVGEVYLDELVYEMKPTSTLTGEAKTFHFALATGRYKDNRIPPKGFRINEAADRISVPVVGGSEKPGYFTAAEYSGGYDDVSMTIASGADSVDVSLYYQTTSREYIEFLRDEINGTGNLTLTDPGASGEPAYIASNPNHPQATFFDGLRAWGDTIWNLWKNNMNVDGAAPFLMAQAAVGAPPTVCTAEVPTLDSATPGNQQIDLAWSDLSAADPLVTGYTVYYDLAGKAQWIADIIDPKVFTYIDVGLTNGQEYCYKVTSVYDCNGDGTVFAESGFSNILCAIPKDQQLASIGVNPLITTPGTVFKAGDLVTFEATVVDGNGDPAAGAVVSLAISGPNSLTLTTGASDASGIATATWKTSKGKKGKGDYTATVTGVTLDAHVWDGVQTSTAFTVQ
jgi:hypothetical protein